MDQVVGTSSPSLGTSSGLDIGGGVDAGCGETTGASVSHGLAGSGSDLSLIDSSIGSGGGVKIYSVIGPSAAKEIAVPASPPATPQFHEAQVSPAPSWSPVSEKEQISGPAFSFWDEITENAEEKSAFSVVSRAKEPILEFGVANLERRAREMLANEHWDDAAVIAVHLNIRRAGPDSATLACEIGDGLRLAQYDNLAVLCYTSAVVSSPPCEPACWRLCEMAISESDPILGPKWTEFIARILHAQGMDNDAITVYRQLLRLSPQRIDVAQMLSSASISNVLPD